MPNGYVKPTVGCPGLLLRRKVWGGRSKLGSNHLEKLGPSSGYKPHHRQTDGQKCQYTSLLSQLQQNLLNMQMFPPALGPLCMSPGSLLSPPPGKKKKTFSWLSHLPNLPGKDCREVTHHRLSSSVSCGSGCLHKRLTASFILRDVNSKNVSSCHCRCKCQKLAFFHQKTE